MTAKKEVNTRYDGSAVNEAKVIKNLSLVSVVGNAVLSGFKLFAGVFGHSGAMISDAIHSFSDILTTIIAFIGVKFPKKLLIIPALTDMSVLNVWHHYF